MRRSTRHAGTSGFPQPFNRCAAATDKYASQADLRFLALPLPCTEQTTIAGIRHGLKHNHSFGITSRNPNPPPFPPFLQRQDPGSAQKKIDLLIADLVQDLRPGIIVLMVEPPPGVSYRDAGPQDADQVAKSLECAAPVCGVILRIGPKNEVIDDEDIKAGRFPGERAILGVFCRPTLPSDVATELLTVVLARAVTEALCYEEVIVDTFRQLGTADLPSTGAGALFGRAKTRNEVYVNLHPTNRFVSLHTSDLLLCPAEFLDALQRGMDFRSHWDEEMAAKGVPHEGKLCLCARKFKNRILPSCEGKETSIYQFFLLKSAEMKGLIEQRLNEFVPEEPSAAVLAWSGSFPKKDNGQVDFCGPHSHMSVAERQHKIASEELKSQSEESEELTEETEGHTEETETQTSDYYTSESYTSDSQTWRRWKAKSRIPRNQRRTTVPEGLSLDLIEGVDIIECLTAASQFEHQSTGGHKSDGTTADDPNITSITTTNPECADTHLDSHFDSRPTTPRMNPSANMAYQGHATKLGMPSETALGTPAMSNVPISSKYHTATSPPPPLYCMDDDDDDEIEIIADGEFDSPFTSSPEKKTT